MATSFDWILLGRQRDAQMALPLGEPMPARRVDLGYPLYLGLHLTGFAVTTLLMTWGLVVLFFLSIGAFSLDGLMHHVANLSTRYIAADAERVAGFKQLAWSVQLGLAAAIIFFRRHAILPRGARAGAISHD